MRVHENIAGKGKISLNPVPDMPILGFSDSAPTRKLFVYKIQVNPIHTILKYGNYYDFMDR